MLMAPAMAQLVRRVAEYSLLDKGLKVMHESIK